MTVKDIHRIHKPVFAAAVEEYRARTKAAAIIGVSKVILIIIALSNRIGYVSIRYV